MHHHKDGISPAVKCWLILVAYATAVYWEMFRFGSFGPEFPLVYFYNDGLSFALTLRAYTYNALMWYRPTALALPYWTGEQFLGWHDLAGWRIYHFATVLATCGALFWFVVRCLNGNRTAGLLAALYFLSQPSLYMTVVEASSFEFLHILLAILCVGLYRRGRDSLLQTAAAWVCFVAALTAKEMALAIPVYLLAISGRRRIARVLPFFAVLPLYYYFHLAKVPPGSFSSSGAYRLGADWGAIAANGQKFVLWILRIYAGDPPYLAGALNNAVGIAILAMVAVQWWRHARGGGPHRVVLLEMLAWTGVFLAIPVYAGGFLWHINLAMVGYAVLAGMAGAWSLEMLPRGWVRLAAGGAALLALLLISRANVRAELDSGLHATGFRINHALLGRPPVASERLGKAPLIYLEDRLKIGPWWYGCFGKLFNYVYLRHDIDEVIVPPAGEVPADLRKRWLAHPNAWFFRYDQDFIWHDASTEFREANPAEEVCAEAAGAIRIAAGGPGSTDRAGRVWDADAFHTGGKTFSTGKTITGTDSPELYQYERFEEAAPLEYRFCVPDGNYLVRLKFAEIWFTKPGQRIYDVVINGRTVLHGFDPLAAAGAPNRAVDREFRVSADRHEMRIRFQPVLGNPKVSAIEIIPDAP